MDHYIGNRQSNWVIKDRFDCNSDGKNKIAIAARTTGQSILMAAKFCGVKRKGEGF